MCKLNKAFFILQYAILILSINCFAQDSNPLSDPKTEAHDDSIKMAAALKMQASFTNKVSADAETDPVESLLGDDAADDPAIWINRKRPEKSLIIGTNKKAGLYIYNLQGKMLQFVRSGKINNVDLRDGFTYQNKKMVLVAASNRSLNAISIHVLDPETGVLSDTIANIQSGVNEVYGICIYHQRKTDKFYALVNGKDGKIEQWEIKQSGKKIEAINVMSFSVATQPEGMVVDDKTGTLYLGVEDEGIYTVRLGTEPVRPELIKGSNHENPAIAYDIEGIALFEYKKSTYLIASSQGNFSYAIFNTSDHNKYVCSFVITDNAKIDGVEETDGLEISNFPCGKEFPQGIMVVQDGFNTNNQKSENQNFKIVSLAKIFPFLKFDKKR